MVQFNFSERTIKAKVVYYGPAQSGKTTNLEQIHKLTDPAGNNRLISLNTAQDRTLFFDLLPFSLGGISGYDFKIQLYTVPGQVQYNATRRVVLAGADAVVFVADSRKGMFKENLQAFENMKVNLLANRLVPEKVPFVVQYNKRDLPDLQTADEMGRALNPWRRPAFEAIAAQGGGVLETFTAVVEQMLGSIAVKYNLKEKGLDPDRVPELVAAAFREVMKKAAVPPSPDGTAAAPVAPAKVVLVQPPLTDSAPLAAASETGLVSEELLHRAIKSNVELAEALADVVHEMNVGLGTILSHAELLGVYREDQKEKRTAALQSIQKEAGRLRSIMQNLGQAGASAQAAPATTGRAAVTPTAARPAASRPPAGAAPTPAPAAAAGGARPLMATVNDAVNLAKPALQSRGISVDVRIPPGTEPPRCPPQNLTFAVAALLQGISAASSPGTATVLRCEKKPVLLKSANGEVKKDFVMLAIAHGGAFTNDDQLRILRGADSGPLGETFRLVREMGGFLRFAPLPGGGLETRLFLPAA
jgi:signal recognition particle receptor subunit beta